MLYSRTFRYALWRSWQSLLVLAIDHGRWFCNPLNCPTVSYFHLTVLPLLPAGLTRIIRTHSFFRATLFKSYTLMTSRHRKPLPITGPLWGEFTSDQNEELWCFLSLFTGTLEVNPLPPVVPRRAVYYHRIKYHHCATLKTWVVMMWTFRH